MNFKVTLLTGLLGTGILFGNGIALAQSAAQLKRERIQSSYLIAFGKAPSEGEITYWLGRNDANTIAEMVNFHRSYLQQDAGTRRESIIKSYVHVLGRNPSQSEISYWAKGTDTYMQLCNNHVSWLQGNSAEYENVIKRSYHTVLGRQPSAAEISYWKGQGTYSYMILVGCHENWKKQTATKTSGSNTIPASSSYLVQIPVSVSVAQEARSVASMVAAGAGNMVAAGAGNMVAAGAGNMVAAGAGNMVAAGAGN